MRAVNLIPSDAAGGGGSRAPADIQATVYAVLGLLAVLLVLMVIYVSKGNSVNDRRVQIDAVHLQIDQTQAALGQLTSYVQFQQLAQSRAQTVKQIADGRYDWAQTLGQLARVIPVNTTLTTVSLSISPSVATGGASGLRSAITAPAVELSGCTASQVAVARLMSRLRSMPGVTRVTLSSSTGASSSTTSSTTAATTAPSATGSASTGCGRGPTFDMLVFLTPPSGSTP